MEGPRYKHIPEIGVIPTPKDFAYVELYLAGNVYFTKPLKANRISNISGKI